MCKILSTNPGNREDELIRLKKKKKIRSWLVVFTSRTFLVFWVAGCTSVLVDLDHIPAWVLGITEEGRLLHNRLVFLVIAICVCWITLALVARWNLDLEEVESSTRSEDS